ncbi:hypothetical protein Plhal304r1_c002g0008581 [Plasmopara halstedii]
MSYSILAENYIFQGSVVGYKCTGVSFTLHRESLDCQSPVLTNAQLFPSTMR